MNKMKTISAKYLFNMIRVKSVLAGDIFGQLKDSDRTR